jgi:hypothetical protein
MDRQPSRYRGTHEAQKRQQAPWRIEHAGSSSVFVDWNAKSVAPGGTRTDWPLNWSTPGHGRSSPVEYRHMNALLLVHDALCRHGVATASRLLSESQIAEGIDGCGYFELPDLALTMSEIMLAAESPLSARVFDDEYRRRYGRTDVVADAILKRIANRS